MYYIIASTPGTITDTPLALLLFIQINTHLPEIYITLLETKPYVSNQQLYYKENTVNITSKHSKIDTPLNTLDRG